MAKVVALRQPRCCQPAIGSVHIDAFALMTRHGNATPQFYIGFPRRRRPLVLHSKFFILKTRRDETLYQDILYLLKTVRKRTIFGHKPVSGGYAAACP